MQAVDLTAGKELAARVVEASGFLERLEGLLGQDELPKGDGMWIRRCSSVHSFGMSFPIDVLFLDRENRAVGLAGQLAPNRIAGRGLKADSVLELPAGTLAATGTTLGNRIEFRHAAQDEAGPRPGRLAGYLLGYLMLMAAHLALIWALPYFPSQDGPSHLYNLSILNDLLHGGRTWGEFYSYRLHPSPNLGFLLVGYPLVQVMSVYAAERCFLSLYLVLMLLAVPFLLRSFKKPAFPSSFLACTVLFNFNLMMGFYSFALAVPLCLFAVGISWRLRRRGSLPRLVLVNLMAALLYLCHLTGYAIFVLSQALLALVGEPEAPSRSRLLQALVILLPQLAVLGWFLGQGRTASWPAAPAPWSPVQLASRAGELLFFSTVSFGSLHLVAGALLVAYCYLLARPRFRAWLRTGCPSPEERYLAWLSSCLVLVYLMAPNRLADGGYLNERFPWVILLFGLPLLATPAKRTGCCNWLAAPLALVFLVTNAILFWDQSLKVAEFVAAHDVALPSGAQVASFRPMDAPLPPVDPMLHAVSHLCLARRYVNAGNYETRFGYFPVRFSNKLAPLPAPEAIAYRPREVSWQRYPSIGYLFGLDLSAADEAGLAGTFRMVAQNGRHSVWQRVATGTPHGNRSSRRQQTTSGANHGG